VLNPAAPGPNRTYQCVLDDQPHYLVPPRLLSDLAGDEARALVVNPRCRLSWIGHQAPSADAGLDVVWVPDPVVACEVPFTPGARCRAALGSLQPGDPFCGEVPERLRAALRAARVLIVPDDDDLWSSQRAETILNCAHQFRARGYATLTDVIHPFHLGAMRRYYRCLLRTGRMKRGDSQSPRRFVAHNESVARFFHGQLTGLVRDLAGEPVKPSYSYVSAYHSGAELPRHIDRQQCEFSISLLVDYSPEPDLETQWPLILEPPDGTVSISQALGDALVYRGRQIPHYRRRLDVGMTSTSIFFHYVRESFGGSLT
jgi:hypothetical protein